ncbi:MAG: LptF/LptG family permease [Hydrogenobaculum sp.]|nr:MAG: permease-like protein [Hydrogenobaculum sp.]
MLLRFITKRFLLAIFLVYLSILAIFFIYQISNFFITYHMKSPKILFQTILNFLPIVLFYTATINVSISVFVSSHYLKRIKMFLVPQSFGIPISYIFKPFIVVSLLVSFGNLILNEFFIPNATKELKYIEHVYKKNQKYELGIARNLWIAKEKNNEKTFIGTSLATSNGLFYNIKIINVKNDKFNYIIKAKKAVVKNGYMDLEQGIETSFSPFKETYFQTLHLKTEIDPKDLNLWIKTPDEQSLTELVKTAIVMRKEGLNTFPYISTFIFKLEFSFLPFLMVCIASFYIAKSQNTIDWYKAFLWHAFLFGIGIAIPYSLSSKTNINPTFFVLIFIFMSFYALKRIFDIQRANWF